MRHFLRAAIWSANVFFFTTAASPLFTWSYVNPSGFVQPNASVPVDVTITNTGSTVIHGINGIGIDDTFTLSPYNFSFNDSLFVSDLNLAPGQTSAPLTLGTFSPNPAPVPSGTYAINQSQFTFLEAFDTSFTSQLVAASQTFQRTVRPGPEFTWQFVPPVGTFGVTDVIPVFFTITNIGNSHIVSFGGAGEDDNNATPDPYGFSFSPDFFLPFDLAPGQTTAPRLFGTFTPHRPAPPGIYSILNSGFTNITLGDSTGFNTIAPTNTFDAVVAPEPATFAIFAFGVAWVLARRFTHVP